jgi:hypothetical protein
MALEIQMQGVLVVLVEVVVAVLPTEQAVRHHLLDKVLLVVLGLALMVAVVVEVLVLLAVRPQLQ